MSHMNVYNQEAGEPVGLHRGAIDQTTITTQPPRTVMKHVKEVLANMGVEIQVESEYKYRCIRAKRGDEERKIGAAASGVGLVLVGEASPQARQLSLPPFGSDSNTNTPWTAFTSGSGASTTSSFLPPQDTAYGARSEDPGDEVRFSVELTRLDRLAGTYSLDIRRLKGNLRSYKFLYDALRQRAQLGR